MAYRLAMAWALLPFTLGCTPAAPATGATASLAAECPGGISSDGDCCVQGKACGATCIAANATCSAPAAPSRVAYTVRRIAAPGELPTAPPGEGAYRVHLIDVGTGLAMLVQGHDFSLLFDAGSADDKRGISSNGNNSRLLAYLWHVVGASGPAACAPRGDSEVAPQDRPSLTLDHVVLSHPHEDHGVFLDELLTCYDVDHLWDVGVVNDTRFYRQFLEALASETRGTYHTVAPVAPDRTVAIGDQTVTLPPALDWKTFARGDRIELGEGARFDVLYATADDHGDHFNEYSLVLRVALGDASLLLTGDTEAGGRADPSAPAKGAEGQLLAWHQAGAIDLDVDLLQVAHHGSMTSSRRSFLEAVSPTMALIGAGPKRYGTVVLPDDEVIAALEGLSPAPQILRTDPHDGGCDADDRVGSDEDRPGGCDNWIVDIAFEAAN